MDAGIMYRVNVNEIHNRTQHAPQEHENKIVSTYKRKEKESNQPSLG